MSSGIVFFHSFHYFRGLTALIGTGVLVITDDPEGWGFESGLQPASLWGSSSGSHSPQTRLRGEPISRAGVSGCLSVSLQLDSELSKVGGLIQGGPTSHPHKWDQLQQSPETY